MHFVPGVAEYGEPGKDAFRIFINEDTIRKMNPSFAGRPIFVEHVDEVDPNLSDLRKEADGWVVDSFYNAADGKTWAKFIVVSEIGLSAIRRGWKLSNAYVPKSFGDGGLWNGVSYQKEVTSAEFEHLAIVSNPRYEESVIMSPDQFKAYNEEKTTELKKFANSKKGETKMGFSIFKKQKVENSLDLEGLVVELPKSKKELSLTKVINDYDTILNMNGYANGDHMVKCGNDEMSVNDLVKKHMEACNELEKMKSAKSMEGGEPGKGADDDDPAAKNSEESLDEDLGEVGSRGGDKHLSNEEEGDSGDEGKDKDKKDKMKNAREKAKAVKTAPFKMFEDAVPSVELSMDQVARGKARYGSGQ